MTNFTFWNKALRIFPLLTTPPFSHTPSTISPINQSKNCYIIDTTMENGTKESELQSETHHKDRT